MDGELYVLALLRGNTTFQLTSIKLFHEGDIKINDKPKRDPKLYNPELYDEGEGDMDIIPPTIPLKRGRGRPRKYPNIMVFL
jgi:hypothetical protein